MQGLEVRVATLFKSVPDRNRSVFWPAVEIRNHNRQNKAAISVRSVKAWEEGNWREFLCTVYLASGNPRTGLLRSPFRCVCVCVFRVPEIALQEERFCAPCARKRTGLLRTF